MKTRRLTTALLAGTAATWLGTAGAGLLTYDFSFTVAGGALDGTAWSGQYSFDNATLTGSGPEYLSLLGFNFRFNGVTYGLGDDPSATVHYFDGTLLGLTYAATSPSPAQSISFQAGFFDLTEQTFSYTYAGQTGGAGEPGNPITTAEVPVPGTLWFAPLLAGLLAARRRRPGPSGSAPGAHRTEVILGGLALGALTVAGPLLFGYGCGEDPTYGKVTVTMADELNPNQTAVFEPPGTYTGKNPEDNYGNKTIEIVALNSPAADIAIAGCYDYANCFTARVARLSNVQCTLIAQDNKYCEIGLYPRVTRAPVVWNDTPYAITVKDASGQPLKVQDRDGNEVAAIPPTLPADPNASPPRASDQPTVLPAGAATLEFPTGFPGTVTWADPYVAARDRVALTRDGVTYDLSDPGIWRVIRVSATVTVVVSSVLDDLGYGKRPPGGPATVFDNGDAFGITATGGTHAADLLYQPQSGAAAVTGVRGCPGAVTTEDPDTRVCALDLAVVNWSKVIKETDDTGAFTGKIIIEPYR